MIKRKLGRNAILSLLVLGAVAVGSAACAPAAQPAQPAQTGAAPAAPAPAPAPAPAITVEGVWARPSKPMAMENMGGENMGGENMGGENMGGGNMDGENMGHMAGGHMAHGNMAGNTDGNMAAMGATSAIYMTIANTGASDDTLLAARADVATAVELHETTMQDDVMKMQPVENIPVPAGGSVELKRGGLHIMLLGVKQELKAGDTFPAVLVFAQAGEIPITVTVQDQ